MLSDDQNKKIGESQDVLDAIGQENEKEGIRWTKYFMDIWDQKEREKKEKKRDRLKKATVYKKMEYYRIVAGMLQQESANLDVPDRYMVWSEFSEQGVIVRLASPSGEKFSRAFKPSGEPVVDLNAVFGLLVDVQSTIDMLEDRRYQKLKDSGIIIP